MPMLKTPWRRARSLDTLVDEIEERFPGTTIWTLGDEAHQRRNSDHNSNSQGVICGIDVVGRRQAKALWDFLAEVRDPRMKYDIHSGQIMSSTISPWSARPYTGSNAHEDHLHLSVGRGPDNYSSRADLYDDPSPWGFSGSKSSPSPKSPQEDDIMIDKNTDLPNPSNAVIKHQNALMAWRKDILPEFGADGDFGSETEDAVKAYQRAADLPVTGRIDGVTSALLLEWLPDRRSGGGGLTRAQADKRYVRKGINSKITQ